MYRYLNYNSNLLEKYGYCHRKTLKNYTQICIYKFILVAIDYIILGGNKPFSSIIKLKRSRLENIFLVWGLDRNLLYSYLQPLCESITNYVLQLENSEDCYLPSHWPTNIRETVNRENYLFEKTTSLNGKFN